MKKLILVYVVLIIAVILLAITRAGNIASILPFGKTASAQIGKNKINLIVAKNDKDRIKGLSGRKNLGENEGMLFVFEKKDKHGFWMKEMLFPIDIIYIDDDTVVYIVENAPSRAQAPNLTIYTPPEPANYVLETNAGIAKKFNIKKGTKITFKGI